MKSKYVVIFIICLFFAGPLNILADCSNAEISRLKKIANNVNVTYEAVETDNGITYNVVFLNMTNELVIRDTDKRVSYGYTGSEMVFSGYQANTSYKFKILPSNGCNTSLVVKYVNLPGYNSYYKDPLCQGIENYSLCQKWNNSNISYETFVKEVTKYKESLVEKNEGIVTETKKESIIDVILNFLANYYYIVCIAIIVICLPIMYILKKKDEL